MSILRSFCPTCKQVVLFQTADEDMIHLACQCCGGKFNRNLKPKTREEWQKKLKENSYV